MSFIISFIMALAMFVSPQPQIEQRNFGYPDDNATVLQDTAQTFCVSCMATAQDVYQYGLGQSWYSNSYSIDTWIIDGTWGTKCSGHLKVCTPDGDCLCIDWYHDGYVLYCYFAPVCDF